MVRCILISLLCLLLALLLPFLLCASAAPAVLAVPALALTNSAPPGETAPPGVEAAVLSADEPEADATPESAPAPASEPVPGEAAAEPEPAPTPAPAAAPEWDTPVCPGADARQTVTVLLADGPQETTLAAYLPGVLAGEMPASFELQALRAQAVAARTYILCRAREGNAAHPQAAVCGEAGCCEAWLDEAALRERWGESYERYAARLAEAVADTDGIYLCWEGKPIHACFHSSSPGETESAEAVWEGARPYLVSVLSPETAADVPNFLSSARWESEALRAAVLTCCPQAQLSGPPESWVEPPVLDASGRVATVRIGGAALTGTQARELFSLRSAAFSLWWTGKDFLFTVVGYGHGVGMSQYGANVMAAHGDTWREILRHYYPGTELYCLP